ncbi:MAG: hypothetical protein JKY48_00285 [Flavobacteriales bacterium]|nr:hypothetical protein [Flavobacteriales bacterium]
MKEKSGSFLLIIDYVLFVGLIITYLFPIISNDYFLTQDSPSHLYNSHVLNSLLLGEGETLSAYYNYDISLSPNLISTAFYSTFSFFFSPMLTYKLVHLIIWLLLPISVYYVIRSEHKENGYLAMLSIPFLYTSPFILGFDSFCLGLSFALLLFGYWIRKSPLNNYKKIIFFSLLSLLLYFTHLLTICFFLLLVGVYTMRRYIKESGLFNKQSQTSLRKEGIRQLVNLLAFLPVALLIVYYLYSLDATSIELNSSNSSFNQLLKMNDLKLFYSANEGSYSKVLSILIFALIVISLMLKLKNKDRGIAPIGWVTVLILLLLYLFTPDALAGGSFISSRLGLLFFISAIISLSGVVFPKGIKYPIIGITLYLSMALYVNKAPYFEKLNAEVTQIMSLLEKVEDHSTLLHLNYHPGGVDLTNLELSYGKGLFHHVACFISFQKKDVVILKNYETNHSYFPISWKPEQSPNLHLTCSAHSMNEVPPCVQIDNFNNNTRSVDYVFLYKHPEKEHLDKNGHKVFQYLKRHYQLISEKKGGIMRLYKKI